MPPGWNLIGPFRILVKPLFDNPAFNTHRIFLGARFLGAQVSVPTLSDCEWLLRTCGRYVPDGVRSRVGMSYQERQEIFHSTRRKTQRSRAFTVRFRGRT